MDGALLAALYIVRAKWIMRTQFRARYNHDEIPEPPFGPIVDAGLEAISVTVTFSDFEVFKQDTSIGQV